MISLETLAIMLSVPLLFVSAFLIFKPERSLDRREKLMLFINPLLISIMVFCFAKSMSYTLASYKLEIVKKRLASAKPEDASSVVRETLDEGKDSDCAAVSNALLFKVFTLPAPESAAAEESAAK